MEKIVILDGYVANSGDLSWNALENLGEVTVYDRTAPGEVVERANDATAIYTNKVVITDEIMEALPALKFIGVLATGYNNVDIEAAHRREIAVCNVPAYSTDSVAQLVFAEISTLSLHDALPISATMPNRSIKENGQGTRISATASHHSTNLPA